MHFQVNEKWGEEVPSNFTEKNGIKQMKIFKYIGMVKDIALTKAETRGRTEKRSVCLACERKEMIVS